MSRGHSPHATFADDQRRFSAEITRAFTSVIRASALGPQSKVSEPDSDKATGIVRGFD